MGARGVCAVDPCWCAEDPSDGPPALSILQLRLPLDV